MRDTDLRIQDDELSWMKLIEGDDHRLTKAVSGILVQRCNGHLILPWTQSRHLLYAFWLPRWKNHMTPMFESSMAEFQKVTKAYYSTVEGFLTSDPLLLNLRRVAGHIKRGSDICNRVGTCGVSDTLMNGHWEELFGKVEELLDATDDPDNYRMLIRLIIEYSSDSRQRLESFLRPHVIECVQGVIEAMSSSSASGCALALVDLQQQLVDRVEWIYGWMGRSIVDEAFEQVLRDYPDLHDAVEAQVSVLCQSFMSLTMVISLDIVRRMKSCDCRSTL